MTEGAGGAHYLLCTGGRDVPADIQLDVIDTLGFYHAFYLGRLRVLHGGARGVDTWVEEYCQAAGIPTKVFRPGQGRVPSWPTHRNQYMVDCVFAWLPLGHTAQVVAFIGGRGTADCTRRAEIRGLDVIYVPSLEEWAGTRTRTARQVRQSNSDDDTMSGHDHRRREPFDGQGDLLGDR